MTLIELMIVVAIIGLLAGAASLKLSGLTGRAQFEQAADRLQFIDAGMRAQAVRSNEPCRVEFQMDGSRVSRARSQDKKPLSDVILPGSVRVSQVQSTTRNSTTGKMRIHYSPTGTSDTYAIELTADSQEPRWLLFAGLTGQMTMIESERDVEDILQTSRSTRPDTR